MFKIIFPNRITSFAEKFFTFFLQQEHCILICMNIKTKAENFHYYLLRKYLISKQQQRLSSAEAHSH